MWISAARSQGLRACSQPVELERIVTVDRPWVDALALFVLGTAGVDHPVSSWLEWDSESTEHDDQLEIGAPDQVARLRSPEGEPRFRVTLDVMPDPPLFGRLRNHVMRQPVLADGLGAGRLSIQVGWMFTPDLLVAHVDPPAARLGEVPVPEHEAPWLAPLAAELGERIQIVDWREPIENVIEGLLAALWAPEPSLRLRAERALIELERLGLSAEPIRTGRDDLGLGATLDPLRHAGPEGELLLRMVVAALVDAPDVLVLPWMPKAEHLEWLEKQTQGDDAVLEQVVVCR